MNVLPICAASMLLAMVMTCAETVDQAVGRFLAGETLSGKDHYGTSDLNFTGPPVDGQVNNGTEFLHQMKCSIIDPDGEGDWWKRSELVRMERQQAKTYRELKAIYGKHKTPIVAFALICPAMYVNDFDLLPELIEKIGENKHLKAHFDKVYASHWKPMLDPDF